MLWAGSRWRGSILVGRRGEAADPCPGQAHPEAGGAGGPGAAAEAEQHGMV